MRRLGSWSTLNVSPTWQREEKAGKLSQSTKILSVIVITIDSEAVLQRAKIGRCLQRNLSHAASQKLVAGSEPHETPNFGNVVSGAFTPVLAKHSTSFSLIDCISVGVDRMQRNFEPMRKQVEVWQRSELTDVTAKVVIYEAFVEGKLEAPKHLAHTVHDLYFEPKYDDFRPRTFWSLSNAFTSAFKELEPIPQFRATAKLGEFLEARFAQSF